MSLFKKVVEIGRVCLINAGDDKGRLCVIVDVVDQKRALVTGPSTGIKRQAINFQQLSLTEFVCTLEKDGKKYKLSPSAGDATIKKAFEQGKIAQEWAKTSWAKKLAQRKKRLGMNDFERFVAVREKMSANLKLRQGMNEAKKGK